MENVKQKFAWVSLIGFIIAAIAIISYWWINEYSSEQTKQAYTQGHMMQITAPFEGRIKEIPVFSFANVKKGTPLIVMDDGLLQTEYAMAKGEYDYAISEYNLAKVKKQHELQGIKLLQQKKEAAEQKYKHITELLSKYKQLDTKNVGEIEYTRVKANQAEAYQNYLGVTAELEKSEKNYQEFDYQVQSMQAKAEQAQAKLDSKQKALDKKVITAPIDGTVGEIKVKAGQLIKAHDLLVPFFYDKDMWVIADFNEKQFRELKIGQSATVYLDAFPKVPLKATVKLFAPASKRELNQSPFPEQYGQIIRVEQQFPVMIDIIEPNLLQDVIKPGMSSTVTVQTKEGRAK